MKDNGSRLTHPIRRLWTNNFVSEYDAERLENKYGGDAQYIAEEQCKKDVKKHRGYSSTSAISDLSIAVRKEESGGKKVYNCYSRDLRN